MSKKLLFVLALVVMISGGLFAQTHWISGEVSILGGGARYEFMLTPDLSLGANAYWNSLFFFWNELGVDVTARYYLTQTFYVGAGIGFHIHTAILSSSSDIFLGAKDILGGAVTPDVGFRIPIGQIGLFLGPGVKVPITFGADQLASKFAVGVGVVPYFGVGYAF